VLRPLFLCLRMPEQQNVELYMLWTSTEKSTAAESELWSVKAVIAFARQRPFALQAPERPMKASQARWGRAKPKRGED